MADLEDVTLDGRPLQSLRVADLKAALEERGLSKSGQKNALIKRLKGVLMLENLQRTSTHVGFQPNSQMSEEMSQNSFIKQYLAKQQELLRQRLEREAREAYETNDQEDHADVNNSTSCPPSTQVAPAMPEPHKPPGPSGGEGYFCGVNEGQGNKNQTNMLVQPAAGSVAMHIPASEHLPERGLASDEVAADSDEEDSDDDEEDADDEDWDNSARRRILREQARVPTVRERSGASCPPQQQHIPSLLSPQLRQPTPPPSPPPELSYPLPDTPKQSPPSPDVAPPRRSPSTSSSGSSSSGSRSSSPEPKRGAHAERKPGPLTLLARKMESEGAFSRAGWHGADGESDRQHTGLSVGGSYPCEGAPESLISAITHTATTAGCVPFPIVPGTNKGITGAQLAQVQVPVSVLKNPVTEERDRAREAEIEKEKQAELERLGMLRKIEREREIEEEHARNLHREREEREQALERERIERQEAEDREKAFKQRQEREQALAKEREAQALARERALELERQRMQERIEREEKEKREREELERVLEQEREERKKALEEQLAREKALEAERKERERLEREQERLEQERIERERALEQERLERERVEKKKALEQARLEKERLERQQALEQERLERERVEQERLEKERIEREKALQQEKLERERVEREKALEQERLERERVERERALEQEKLEKERIEKERALEQERLERERIQKEKAVEQERLEKERIEKEKALEQKRLEMERLEKERALEQERLERERIEKERALEEERLERERLEKEKALEQERLERERIEKERLEMERIKREKALEQEKLEKQKEEQERIERERKQQEERLQRETAILKEKEEKEKAARDSALENEMKARKLASEQEKEKALEQDMVKEKAMQKEKDNHEKDSIRIAEQERESHLPPSKHGREVGLTPLPTPPLSTGPALKSPVDAGEQEGVRVPDAQGEARAAESGVTMSPTPLSPSSQVRKLRFLRDSPLQPQTSSITTATKRPRTFSDTPQPHASLTSSHTSFMERQVERQGPCAEMESLQTNKEGATVQPESVVNQPKAVTTGLLKEEAATRFTLEEGHQAASTKTGQVTEEFSIKAENDNKDSQRGGDAKKGERHRRGSSSNDSSSSESDSESSSSRSSGSSSSSQEKIHATSRGKREGKSERGPSPVTKKGKYDTSEPSSCKINKSTEMSNTTSDTKAQQMLTESSPRRDLKRKIHKSNEEDEHDNKRRINEIANADHEKLPESSEETPKAFSARKISLSSSKSSPGSSCTEGDQDAGAVAGRKRRWGSSTAVTAKKPSISITTDSLKSLIPEIKPSLGQEAVMDLHPEEAVLSGAEDEECPDQDLQIRRTVTQVVQSENQENGQKESKRSRLEEVEEDVEEGCERMKVHDIPVETSVSKAIERQSPPRTSHAVEINTVTPSDTLIRRSISQQKTGVSITIDDPVRTARQPSPPRGKVSNIVHICNLVRPFTLGQLKELLSRTGTLVEEGFWIDKIKSHCYATYSSSEEASATRSALHGVKWPQSNPKVLNVDFCQQDELDFHKGLGAAVRPGEEDQTHGRTSGLPSLLPERDQWAEREREMERRERARAEREWDRDKVREFGKPGEEKEAGARRSRSRERRRKERGKSKEKKADKKDKAAEDPPAKLLDDLFLKTKAAPCIYWLPLTEEQYLQRAASRAERKLEREKRRKEEEEEEEKREAERKEKIKAAGNTTGERSEGEKDKERDKDRERDRDRGRERDREKERERENDKRRDNHRRLGGSGTGGGRRSRSRSEPRERRR